MIAILFFWCLFWHDRNHGNHTYLSKCSLFLATRLCTGTPSSWQISARVWELQLPAFLRLCTRSDRSGCAPVMKRIRKSMIARSLVSQFINVCSLIITAPSQKPEQLHVARSLVTFLTHVCNLITTALCKGAVVIPLSKKSSESFQICLILLPHMSTLDSNVCVLSGFAKNAKIN